MSVTAESIGSVPTTVDKNAWKALAGSALGYAMDGFDLLILGFMLRTIAADLHLSPAQARFAGDGDADRRRARRHRLRHAVRSSRPRARADLDHRACSRCSPACARSRKAIGICWPIAPSPASGSAASSASAWRWWPKRGRQPSVRARRPMSASAGSSACWRRRLLTPLLLPVIGWRGMFAIGVFPAVAAYFIRALAARAGSVRRRIASDHPKESALRLLVKDGETTKLSLGMIILCSVQNFGYYGVMIWLPNYLSTPVRFCA